MSNRVIRRCSTESQSQLQVRIEYRTEFQRGGVRRDSHLARVTGDKRSANCTSSGAPLSTRQLATDCQQANSKLSAGVLETSQARPKRVSSTLLTRDTLYGPVIPCMSHQGGERWCIGLVGDFSSSDLTGLPRKANPIFHSPSELARLLAHSQVAPRSHLRHSFHVVPPTLLS